MSTPHCVTFPCQDECCTYGVDLNPNEREAILARRAEIAALVQLPDADWFTVEEATEPDAEFPDGRILRTQATNLGCAFRASGRGCVLHHFDLKPSVCRRAFHMADGSLDPDHLWLPCRAEWKPVLRVRRERA